MSGRAHRRRRLAYLARILHVYATRSRGPLAFWYERPTLNEAAFAGSDAYFMEFQGKARYKGPFDPAGVPLLDYRGDIGRRHNPIAVAQYGLARFNAWLHTQSVQDEAAWRAAADWIVDAPRPNPQGVSVLMHDFDWPYRQLLKAPWYSGLAQGNALSLLVRAARTTGSARYASAADAAFAPMLLDVSDGGVLVRDDADDLWIEEYIVSPPSHILNGFIWALWGVFDYKRHTDRPEAHALWRACVGTLSRRLHEFDTGWWSLYEARHGDLEMLASRYYHSLHIVQLQIMFRLTGDATFAEAAARFETYLARPHNRARAFARKAAFKLRHY